MMIQDKTCHDKPCKSRFWPLFPRISLTTVSSEKIWATVVAIGRKLGEKYKQEQDKKYKYVQKHRMLWECFNQGTGIGQDNVARGVEEYYVTTVRVPGDGEGVDVPSFNLSKQILPKPTLKAH